MSNYWMKEEEEFLKENYDKLSMNEIQKALLKINGMKYGRTTNSIRWKVKKMNLHKENTSTFNGVYPYKTILTKIDCDNNYIYKDIK